MHEWIKEYGVAITVCDLDGIITEMNDKAIATFAADGGKELIGKNLFDLHPEHCNVVIRKMLETGKANAYTIEKKGVRKLIYQEPWFRDGKIAGLVEMSLVLPPEMPHHERT